MQELVVLSGKGGTGKTTVTGALAALWLRVVLVDCDVDAANLHLITRPQVRREYSFTASSRANVDMAKCNQCGICLDYCRFKAIGTDGDSFYVDQLACEGCALCSHICPEKAIELHLVESGKWLVSDTPFGPLLDGRLAPAQGNSGKLVTLLRSKAQELARSRDIELTIIDGPPGIGCPTVASITGASYALIVTEPSQSAFHDLLRVIELIRHFGIPIGICINKCDINADITEEIEGFALESGIRVLAKLPYQTAVTRAQTEKRTIVESTDGELVDQIAYLHDGLVRELKQLRERKLAQTDHN
jgi:MinD superfamily P-loop ATPase